MRKDVRIGLSIGGVLLAVLIVYLLVPKDANNNPTQTQGSPNWSFSPGGLVDVGNPNDFTPTVTAKSPGTLSAWVVIDGVTSNTVNITFY